MKILQVNCVYQKGSTGKIVHDIHTELQKQGVESVVCYGRGERISEPGVYKTCGELYSKANNLLSRVTGIMYGGCRISTNRLISIIQKEKPDVVHLHCINGYFVNIYRLVRWLKEHHIKTVLTPHAEFMYTANCGYALDCEKWRTGCGSCPRRKQETKSWFLDGTARSWKRMKRAFEGFEGDCVVTSVSPWLMERAKQAPILKDFRHVTVLNGLDATVFRPVDGTDLLRRYGLENKRVVLHVTASFSLDPNHIKGGWYVVELAKRMPDVAFVVIGSRDTCLELPPNVYNIGRVEDQRELAAWYSAADVTLLTSKKETFSMVTAESLCCGTPVVGFKAGAPEMIALPEWSAFVGHGDMDALYAKTQAFLQKEFVMDDAAKTAYSRETMCDAYMKVYEGFECEQLGVILTN